MSYIVFKDELKHFGIPGQKWGVRRFQNKDGSYTSAGKDRYGKGKETLFQRNKRLMAANAEKNRISYLRGEERQKAQSGYRKKYGFSYTNASVYGVRNAERIRKYAIKKNLSETKASTRYMLSKLGFSLAATAAAHGVVYLAATHPEQTMRVLSKGAKYVGRAAYSLGQAYSEFKVRMDPNIIDGKFTAREIVDIAGLLPYSALANG